MMTAMHKDYYRQAKIDGECCGRFELFIYSIEEISFSFDFHIKQFCHFQDKLICVYPVYGCFVIIYYQT